MSEENSAELNISNPGKGTHIIAPSEAIKIDPDFFQNRPEWANWTLRVRHLDGRIEEIITPSKTYYEVDSDFIMAVEGAQAQRFIRDLREDTMRGVNSKLNKGIAPILAPPGYRNCVEKRQGEKGKEQALHSFKKTALQS